MAKAELGILQVSTADILGGAESVAWNLFRTFRERGHDSYLAVGRKRTDDPHVLRIPNHRVPGAWHRFWWTLHHRIQPFYGRAWVAGALCRTAHRLAEPRSLVDTWRGIEDFHYPGTHQLLRITPRPPDIIHCHNLHGKYFDLRILPQLTRQRPTVLTLHDAWLLSGHCAHAFDCDRWRTGCESCPDLTLYPPIRQDATARNWHRKREIYDRSRLYVATPSRWLMEKVEQSMLAPAIVEARVIPNGIDPSVFHPADRLAARQALDLPQDATILLFAARDARRNIWKDYETLRAAFERVAGGRSLQRLLLVALGEAAPSERIGRAQVRFAPHQEDPKWVACYYQAADLYVHAARADTFPNSVLEALACGIPVVATATGGIPEQIRPATVSRTLGCNAARIARDEEATGILTPQGNAQALAAGIEHLVMDDAMRRCLSTHAATDARIRFNLQRQADDYLSWYTELLEAPEPA